MDMVERKVNNPRLKPTDTETIEVPRTTVIGTSVLLEPITRGVSVCRCGHVRSSDALLLSVSISHTVLSPFIVAASHNSHCSV